MAETGIDGIFSGHTAMAVKSHGAVQKIKKKEGEKSEGQTAVIKVISSVPGLSAGQNSRNHESQHQTESYGQKQALRRQLKLSENIVPLRVPEKEFADKRPETGGKHTDMEIPFKIQLF